MHYEVFIPATDTDGFDVTITVEAGNWMMALKSGLERIGEGPDIVRNVMCDIKSDNSIHVTDATSRRVFVLREIADPETAAPTPDPQSPEDATEFATIRTEALVRETPVAVVQELEPQPEPPAPVAQPEPPAPVAQPVAQPVVAAQPVVHEQSAPEEWAVDSGRLRIGSSTQKALRSEEPKARVLKETRQKTDERNAANIGRVEEKVSESLIEDVFLEIQDIHEGSMAMEDVINFVMDMAVNKVGAESGSILFADVNGRELYFATARGPKAEEIMDFRVPMGKGLVGFCAREGVSLAISDAERDPRFYKEISEALGYETRALLCAPIQHEGRVYGAIELINKKANSNFSSNEMSALSYIGRQLAQYVNDVIMSREKID
ncbi:MAG: GAF domain-containing protein [Bradymonadaceae bacterium]|nr:GAF domain-containing protein [Lujinxingiaceae bacterium]